MHKEYLPGAEIAGKLHFLEGMRGLMAVNVILCHFVCVYYPQMYFQDFADDMGGFLSLFAVTPLSALINGNIAVQYFFVLTGFLVGRTFFLKHIQPEDIPGRSIKRYFRLLPLVCAATVFTFLTMVLGLQKHLEIADLVTNTAFLKAYCTFEPTLWDLLVNIVIDPFCDAGSAYVGPFWTIRYEFWGYILSMIICMLFRNRKFRRLEYIIAAFLCLQELDATYIAFIMGIFVADLLYNKAESILESFFADWLQRKWVVWMVFFAGVYFACCPMYFTTLHTMLGKIPKISTNLVRAAGIAMVLYAAFHFSWMQTILSHRWLLCLGEVSFEMFAMHWPIMMSFQAWVFSLLIPKTTYDMAAVSAFAATLPVIFLSAIGLQRFLKKISKLTTQEHSLFRA